MYNRVAHLIVLNEHSMARIHRRKTTRVPRQYRSCIQRPLELSTYQHASGAAQPQPDQMKLPVGARVGGMTGHVYITTCTPTPWGSLAKPASHAPTR